MSRFFAMSFAKVYPLYLANVEKKGRTRAELDEVIRWLAVVGIVLTAVNMFGGFAVTQRMLAMFRK